MMVIIDFVMHIVQCVSDIISAILIGVLGLWFIGIIILMTLAVIEWIRECLKSSEPAEPIERKRIEWIRTLPDEEFKYVIYKAYRASGGWWIYVETLDRFRKDVGLK